MESWFANLTTPPSEIQVNRQSGLFFLDSIAHGVLRISVLLLLFALMISCQKLRPAGFWSEYQQQRLEKNKWDLGPWGGFAAMHWRAPRNSTFSVKDIVDFAKQNGWERVDTISIAGDVTKTWMNFTNPVFPFTYTDFSDYEHLDFRFPRWIDSDVVIHRFKTGWVALEPGNAKQTDINGYIVVSADKRQFSVYHIWGE